jgi:hypothetical protein
MLVTNEILSSFINCRYKAYVKSTNQSGNSSEYQILYAHLRQVQNNSFKKKLSENGKLLFDNASYTKAFQKEGTSLNINFSNSSLEGRIMHG